MILTEKKQIRKLYNEILSLYKSEGTSLRNEIEKIHFNRIALKVHRNKIAIEELKEILNVRFKNYEIKAVINTGQKETVFSIYKIC